jgi:hypothetical protein
MLCQYYFAHLRDFAHVISCKFLQMKGIASSNEEGERWMVPSLPLYSSAHRREHLCKYQLPTKDGENRAH